MWRSGRRVIPDLVTPTGAQCNVNPFSKSNMASLLHCLRDGNIRDLRNELEAREIDVTHIINGRSQLHYAADHGQVEVLQFLIENGANVNVEDEYGVTPLLTSIWEGHTECVRYLLTQGATMDRLTPDGKTYLEVADKDDIRELLMSELQKGDKQSTSTQLEQESVESVSSKADAVKEN